MHLVADGGGSSAAVPIPRLRPARAYRAEHLRELLQSGDDGRWKSHLLVLVGRETACPLRGDGSACLTLGDQRVECLTCQHGAGVADSLLGERAAAAPDGDATAGPPGGECDMAPATGARAPDSRAGSHRARAPRGRLCDGFRSWIVDRQCSRDFF